MVWLLFGCALLLPATGLPFASVEPAARVEGAVAAGGASSLVATEHGEGASLAWSWRAREETALGVFEETRWRYTLLGADGGWTWESSVGESRGALRIASGETLDLLVEDLARGRFHWTAIDRVARRVLAEGTAPGDRAGDVFARADSFLVSTARGLERFEPRSGAWSVLYGERDACLRANTGAHLWWVAGGALRRGTLDGDEIRDVRDVPWVDPDIGLAPRQRVRVLRERAGWAVVYEVVRAPSAPARQGLHLQRYDAALRPIGGPVQLSGDVARGRDEPLGDVAARGRWEVLARGEGGVVARASDGPGRADPSVALALPRAPGWVRVDAASNAEVALTEGRDGATVWGESSSGGRQLWRRPVVGIEEALLPDGSGARALAAVRALLALPRLDADAVRAAVAAATRAPSPVFTAVEVEPYALDPQRPVETARATLRVGTRCVSDSELDAAFGPGKASDRAVAGGARIAERVVSYMYMEPRGGKAAPDPRQVIVAFDPGDGCARRIEVRHRAPRPAP